MQIFFPWEEKQQRQYYHFKHKIAVSYKKFANRSTSEICCQHKLKTSSALFNANKNCYSLHSRKVISESSTNLGALRCFLEVLPL